MSLRGTHLRVGAGLWVPFVTFEDHEDGSFNTSGILIDFIDILASRLNFTFSVIKAVDGEWGRIHPNGSATGMIGMCQRKEVDLALGPFSITYDRSKIIDYSVPLYNDGFGIFLPRPRKERDLAGFIKPFVWQVWVTILVFMVTSMVLGSIYNHLALKWSLPNALNAGGFDGRWRYYFQPYWILKAVLVEAIDLLPTSITGRVLMGTWFVTAFILSAAYQSILTSVLMVPRTEVPINSLHDLLLYGKMPWAVEHGNMLHQRLNDAQSGVYRDINDKVFYVSTLFAVKERIKTERFAVLSDMFSMKMIMSDDFGETGECSYYIGKELIVSTMEAFAFPKGSGLTKHFNKWLVRMKESGLLDKHLQGMSKNATVCMVPPGKEAGQSSTSVLSMLDLGGVFLIAAGGLTASVIVFLIEKLVYLLFG